MGTQLVYAPPSVVTDRLLLRLAGVLNSQGSGNLQTNFDLLGELIKCNPEVFALLNDTLDDVTYTAFMQVSSSRIPKS